MLKILWYTLSGVLSGVLGGMGMGGGTLLIPLLSLFFAVEQHTAQAVNLISFIPMAIAALIVHFKNGLVDKKEVLWLIIPSLLFGIGFSFVSKLVEGDVLRKIFGGFLIALSVVQFFSDKITEKVSK